MPLYDYACSGCGNSYTVRQSFTDAPQAACPRCGGEGRRRLSVPSVVYKGSGFYSTDYGRRSGSASGTSENGSAPPVGGDGSPAGDSHSHPHPHTDLAGQQDHS